MPGSAKGVRRLVDRVASPYVGGLADHLAEVQGEIRGMVSDLNGRLDEIESRLAPLEAGLGAVGADTEAGLRMLRAVYEKADEQRLRLYELRRSADYAAAFEEDEPLVSFVIPTYDRHRQLGEVAIPSILDQGYRNLEVIVSGDASPPETAATVSGFDDPRVRFIDRTVRGPYPDDPAQRWFMVGTPPLNDGLAAARGRWIAILGDDDEVSPQHTELLVAAAREQRLEHAYGRFEVRFADGEGLELGKFPPEYGQFTLQTSIFHAGLRFFQFEPTDVLYAEPNDWSLCRRMVAAGVRFGMIDEVVAIKHETRIASRAEWLGEATPG